MDNLRRKLLASLEEPGLPAGTVFNYAYTGSVQSVELPKGRYQLQCWGASGGSMTYSSKKGYVGGGGYATGVLNLSKLTTLYVFVGGKGANWTENAHSGLKGGWNCGGSNGGAYVTGTVSGYQRKGASATGGGATDIALVTSSVTYSSYMTTRSTESLKSRIIVAGGGSGAIVTITVSTSNYTVIRGGGAYASLNTGTFGKGHKISSPTGYNTGSGWYSDQYAGSCFVNTAENAQYRPEGYTGLELGSGSTAEPNTYGTSVPVSPAGSGFYIPYDGYARITVL